MKSSNGWEIIGDHKMVSPDSRVFVKVIDFPVPEDVPVAGESMWVIKTRGTDNDGVGILNNIPAYCTEVSEGDLVEYAGGTDYKKPQFVRRVIDERDYSK